jgi:hypothetical protein
MKGVHRKIMLVVSAAVIMAFNLQADDLNHTKNEPHKQQATHKKPHQKLMSHGTVGQLWIYTSYAVGGESFILLARTKGCGYGPTRILSKEAHAQPKTAARIQAENYIVYVMNAVSFAVPPYQKGSPIEYKWVAMDNIFNVIQHAATTDDDDGVSVEARDNSLIVLDKKFVQALVNDFREGEHGVIFTHVDLTRPSETPDVTGYAG